MYVTIVHRSDDETPDSPSPKHAPLCAPLGHSAHYSITRVLSSSDDVCCASSHALAPPCSAHRLVGTVRHASSSLASRLIPCASLTDDGHLAPLFFHLLIERRVHITLSRQVSPRGTLRWGEEGPRSAWFRNQMMRCVVAAGSIDEYTPYVQTGTEQQS